MKTKQIAQWRLPTKVGAPFPKWCQAPFLALLMLGVAGCGNPILRDAFNTEEKPGTPGPVADTTPPALPGGRAAGQASAAGTTATVKFSADEGGTFYYLVLPAADNAPTAAEIQAGGASGGSGPAQAGINTILLDGLTPGIGYTVYILVADAAGNLSAVLGVPVSPRHTGADPAKDRAELNEAALITAGEITLAAPRAGGGSAQVGISFGEDGIITIVIDGVVTEYPYTISGDTIIVSGGGPAGGSGGGDAVLGFVIGDDGTLTLNGLDTLADGDLAPGAVVSEPNPLLTPPPAVPPPADPPPAETAALTAAITAAETLIAGTATGEEAAAVPLDVHYVTGAEKAAYQAAIDAARAARDDGAATAAQLDQAALDLATATGVFTAAAAAKTGTKPGPAPILGVAAVSFAGADYGYARPGAQPITITNTGTGAATISALTLSGDGKAAFALGGSGDTVAAGGSIATRTVQPEAGLGVGSYTAIITVSYDNGLTAAAQVSFAVSPAPITAPSVTALPTPAPGALPAEAVALATGSAGSADPRYAVTGIVWERHTGTGADDWATVATGAAFVPKAAYRAAITLQAAGGYKFASGATAAVTGPGGASLPGATVGGGTIGGGDTAGNTLTFTVSFPATLGGTAAVTDPTGWETPAPHRFGITKSTDPDWVSPGWVSAVGTLTLSLTGGSPGDYTAFQWTVNGKDEADEAAQTYSFTGAGRNPGTYTVGVRAKAADGHWYENRVEVEVIGAKLALEGGYDGAITVEVQGGLLKSITLATGSKILIGRKADELVTLSLNSEGNLQFRAVDADGNVPIGSYAEFQLIRTTRLGTDHSGVTYKQEADLDLMGAPAQQWTAIGSYSARFTGTFDGGGWAIRNLYINSDGDQGLFGIVGGTVQNVHIASGSVTGGSSAGGVAAYNDGTITACSNNATVTGSYDAGGVAARNYSTITNCSNSGDVSTSGSSNGSTGGVVGYNGDGTITNCYNTGDVSGNGIGTECGTGGVMGYNSGDIIACYNTGTVSGGDYSNTGGVMGYNSGDIIACYNTGTVSGGGESSFTGGVVGLARGTITACYNTGAVIKTGSSGTFGGVAGVNMLGTITACYWTDVAGDAASVGVGSSNGSTDTTTKFSDAWPTTGTHTQWGTAAANPGTSGQYWKNLGAWNTGGPSTVYPKLYWEED
ncbi:GLUG motif-containing protein [Treponema primitia]|uniref:GLUG motif-containing protein n=1 Tax=Treponema primitia TaxID=88058 RepID=UPI0003053014|nr:GLUG motif-containing protein [Treponema primitia]